MAEDPNPSGPPTAEHCALECCSHEHSAARRGRAGDLRCRSCSWRCTAPAAADLMRLFLFAPPDILSVLCSLRVERQVANHHASPRRTDVNGRCGRQASQSRTFDRCVPPHPRETAAASHLRPPCRAAARSARLLAHERRSLVLLTAARAMPSAGGAAVTVTDSCGALLAGSRCAGQPRHVCGGMHAYSRGL